MTHVVSYPKRAGKWSFQLRMLRDAWRRDQETELRTHDVEYLCVSCRQRQPAAGRSTCHSCVSWFRVPEV